MAKGLKSTPGVGENQSLGSVITSILGAGGRVNAQYMKVGLGLPCWSANATAIGYIKAAAALLVMSSVTITVIR
jgi:hypothetical protein